MRGSIAHPVGFYGGMGILCAKTNPCPIAAGGSISTGGEWYYFSLDFRPESVVADAGFWRIRSNSCCAVVSNAQTNGIVTDGEKGLPLAGVNIYLQKDSVYTQ